ncbi:MAG: hypothetical protein KTU85_12375, partial [Acidimicrobiia bacterium]|nr:hypothetical protein [Acidimicrobiia bacterium]
LLPKLVSSVPSAGVELCAWPTPGTKAKTDATTAATNQTGLDRRQNRQGITPNGLFVFNAFIRSQLSF